MADEKHSNIHRFEITVGGDVIDENGHVNNVAYVQWMQDAAVRHAAEILADDIYERLQCTWFARSHHIEYLSPAFEGEIIEVRTWIAGYRRVRSQRNYEFVRLSDDKLLARGETDWVFVSAENGRPKTIPAEITDAFSVSVAD